MRTLFLAVALIANSAALAEEMTVERLLTEAARAAERAQDPQSRALCMADIATVWHGRASSHYEDAVARAIDYAAAERTEMGSALALRSVARRIGTVDPDRAAQILETALAIAAELKGPLQRTVVLRELTALAATLGHPSSRDSANGALEAARSLDDALLKAAALRDLAATLSTIDADLAAATFREAAAVVRAIPLEEAGADLARVELAAAWAVTDFTQARQLVDEVVQAQGQNTALAGLAVALASARPDAALALAQELPDGPHRAAVIAAAAAELHGEGAQAAGVLAEAALSTLGDQKGETADRARLDAAAALAAIDPTRARETVLAIHNEELRNEGLAEVALRTAARDPDAAIDLLGSIDDPGTVEPALAEIACRIAPTRPDRAAEIGRSLLSRQLRSQVLVAVARALAANGTMAP